MASNILLENKKTRNTVELEDIPETFEEFDNFVKENFFKDPSDNLSYEYSDAQGEMNILTEANYDKRVLQEILDSDKPKIVVIDDDDSSDEEDDKEVNLDTLSFAKSLVSNKSNISEKKPNEEKKENDSKKNEVPETKITDNKKPDDNKPNDDVVVIAAAVAMYLGTTIDKTIPPTTNVKNKISAGSTNVLILVTVFLCNS